MVIGILIKGYMNHRPVFWIGSKPHREPPYPVTEIIFRLYQVYIIYNLITLNQTIIPMLYKYFISNPPLYAPLSFNEQVPNIVLYSF